MNISDIKVNPSNPRFIKDDRFKKLVQSIKEFPKMMELRPIVVDSDNMILGGNMRFRALKELKYKEITDKWVKRAEDLTEEEKRRFIIEDNIPFGEWDYEALANEWEEASLTNWGLELPQGFGNDKDIVEDEYEIPDKIVTDIKSGDLFQIGEHRLLCGSAVDANDYKRLFDKSKADLILTDPPYNVDYVGKNIRALKMENDKMSDDDFYRFLSEFYILQAGYSKKGAPWYVWHAETESLNFRLAMMRAGIKIRQCLIWKKHTMVMGRQDYHWKHEPCLYGWTDGARHPWYADRKQTTILEFDKPSSNKDHPTMKPVSLIGYQMKNSSKEGDIISDPFIGSGTAMIAAHQAGRICYGMEIDPKYCQVVINRMKSYDPNIKIKRNGKDWEAEC